MKKGWFGIWIWRITTVLATAIALFLGLRVLQSERQPDLAPWHTWAPRELAPGDLDKSDWQAWLAAEDALFREVEERMNEKLETSERIPSNRYFNGSPVHPASFARNWNRSYTVLPEVRPAAPSCCCTDFPIRPTRCAMWRRSTSTMGSRRWDYACQVTARVPAGLTSARWQDWQAATRLAMREARRLAGPGKPLHIVGYSNGGALAVQYTLDAVTDSLLDVPARVVLFSPMIGVTRFARFAGLAGWPSVLPRFSKTAWLEIVPEFNPFKYSSFPVNAGRQSYELTQSLAEKLNAVVASGVSTKLPPVLAFQSSVDSHRGWRGAHQWPVRQTTEEWQRARVVRCEPRGGARPAAVSNDAREYRTDGARGRAELPHHSHRQFKGRMRT